MKRKVNTRSHGVLVGGVAGLLPLLGAVGVEQVAQVPEAVPPLLWWAGSVFGPIVAGVVYEVVAHRFRLRAARKRADAGLLKVDAKRLLEDGDPTNDDKGIEELREAVRLEAEAKADEALADRVGMRNGSRRG